ncbi:MAG: hypothetical protein ACRELB_27495 [Polyangiaceae bacterium]
MRRRIAIALLALGTVLGYGSAAVHAARAHHACHSWRGATQGDTH